MNEIVKQRIEDMEAKAGIQFADKCNYVKVVRCKDCIYHGKRNNKECCTRLEVAFPIMYGDDFCSYGERKTGDE